MFSTMPSTGTSTLLEHGYAAPGVDQREILRRRDDHRAGERHVLGKRELRIAGAGRHIDDKAIEFAPGDFAQQLLNGAHDHRPAPDHGVLLGDEETDRHGFDAIGLERTHDAPVGRRLALETEQARQRRTINISVENADAPAERGKGQRQIDGGRRFADPALSGGDGDDIGDAGNGDVARRRRVCGRRGVGCRPGLRRRLRRAIGGEADKSAGDATDFLHRDLGGRAHRLERASAGGVDRD